MIRHGRYGEFTACSGYPDCKFVKQNFIGVKCPLCADGELVEKKGAQRQHLLRVFEISEVQIHFRAQAHRGEVPDCGHEYLVERLRKDGVVIACPNKECDYERESPGGASEVTKSGESSAPQPDGK